MLVLMSGLPGTGKSVVAAGVALALPAALVSADPIDVALARAGQPNDEGKAGYEVMKAIAREQLALGLHVVIDAVNPFGFVRQAYVGLAAEFATPTAVILTICRDSAVHRARIEERRAAGMKRIDWAGVERQIAYYEPHVGEALTLDALDAPDDNTASAVAYVLERKEAKD